MPQISKRKLDKDIEKEIFKQFWNSLARVKDSETASQFYSDLLTETEKVMLAKRFTVSILLIRGKNPSEIKNTIHVTYSTIGSVASWVKNAKPATRKLLTALSNHKEWENILDRIEEVLDKLPPRYGSNWSEAGKEKWKRTKARSTRRALR
ncbi:hypothetical protein A2125_02040 [Candidatus Woesebacteria bacterium GWB1_43_5]|uniref:TrpR like protein, YerC/YecD n=1 Tax=Candidatus Woesebacteria bacterium GWB1_43_5 TaxID=1802474 RepID=A0A1F7WTG7_9BACT|nr:MAG: hypothetical protein A2125_02040 [Candidatus Woesebacteria bacterium GWB1_43_5]